MRRSAVVTISLVVTLASCGGSDETTTATEPPATIAATTVATDPPATAPPATAPPATAPPATAPPATDPPATEPPATTTPAETNPPATAAPGGQTIAVSLVEWEVIAPTAIEAGPTTFEVANDGDFRHHFGVARGNSYEELPQLPGGAIDEATLGDDYLGRTENIDFGGSATFEADLEPGNYVLFCNIVAGPSSHAARGQVLAITVG